MGEVREGRGGDPTCGASAIASLPLPPLSSAEAPMTFATSSHILRAVIVDDSETEDIIAMRRLTPPACAICSRRAVPAFASTASEVAFSSVLPASTSGGAPPSSGVTTSSRARLASARAAVSGVPTTVEVSRATSLSMPPASAIASRLAGMLPTSAMAHAACCCPAGEPSRSSRTRGSTPPTCVQQVPDVRSRGLASRRRAAPPKQRAGSRRWGGTRGGGTPRAPRRRSSRRPSST